MDPNSTPRKDIHLMALTYVAQTSRNALLASLVARAVEVGKDAGFQEVLRREGWRFLVSAATEARAAWLRTGQR